MFFCNFVQEVANTTKLICNLAKELVSKLLILTYFVNFKHMKSYWKKNNQNPKALLKSIRYYLDDESTKENNEAPSTLWIIMLENTCNPSSSNTF